MQTRQFSSLCHLDTWIKSLVERDDRGEWVVSNERLSDMPAVFCYHANSQICPETWLHEDTFNCGNDAASPDPDGNAGSRSVIYVALRMLFYLGVRRVYLLSCDFRMGFGKQNYAFNQARSKSSILANNRTYRILNRRLRHLKPFFDAEGFQVFNCTPGFQKSRWMMRSKRQLQNSKARWKQQECMIDCSVRKMPATNQKTDRLGVEN